MCLLDKNKKSAALDLLTQSFLWQEELTRGSNQEATLGESWAIHVQWAGITTLLGVQRSPDTLTRRSAHSICAYHSFLTFDGMFIFCDFSETYLEAFLIPGHQILNAPRLAGEC